MSQEIIAVDIDEVLQSKHAPFLIHHNNTYGTAFAYPDPAGRYYLEQINGDSSELVEEKLQVYIKSDAFRTITPLDGAAKAIRRLRESGYEFAIVTARQSFFNQATNQFVEEQFPNVFTGVHFIEHFPGSALTPAEAKLEICQGIGAQYLIDDNLGTATPFALAGIEDILFGDYPWNQAETRPKIVTRCKDWLAVVEYFDAR